MDDDETRANQRRRARQINREDDRTMNRRNEPQNYAHLQADEDERLPLNLSLGSTSYSSQIPPVTPSLQLAPPSPSPFPPPPMTTWPSPADLMMAQMPYSTFPYSYQIGSRGSSSTPIQPPVDFLLPSVFAPPPNQTAPARPVMRPITSVVRNYRSSSHSAGNQSNTITPPFPWATDIRGVIHSLEYLESKQITTITGDVQCRHCEKVYQVSYNLRERFAEVEKIFAVRKRIMRERAPQMWTNPEPRRCELCGREKAVKPVIAERKSQINWLFLLLGQTLGYCTLQQLKNFCKHSKSHRTGAKDRVLYLTYLGLCKMLQPNRELFDRETGVTR